MLGVLLDAARPFHCGRRAVLRPLWAEEAMHRACNMLHLLAWRDQIAGPLLQGDVAFRVDNGVANDLATLYRTLDIRRDDAEMPCSCVLRGGCSESGRAVRIRYRTDRHSNGYRAPLTAGV